jgi:RNA polymerase sigma factor (sigma-70 family)
MLTNDLERLYRTEATPLYGFLAYRTGDPDLAEDLLADTFERALRARRRFNPLRGSKRTWLFSIALNCLRDRKRREGAERRALERAPASLAPPATTVELVERKVTLDDALHTLSPEEREALALRYGADLTLREMAAVTEQPRTTVEGRVYRALAKLRDELSADAADD